MSHLAHEARSWNYAKARGWEFECLASTPVLPHQDTFRVQGPLKSPGPCGTINPDRAPPFPLGEEDCYFCS